MNIKDSFPATYEPYQYLKVCSNTILGGGTIFEMRGTVPLLIGKGAPPLVWLASAPGPDRKKPTQVIEASISQFDAVSVLRLLDVATTVFFGSTMVLSVKRLPGDAAEIDALDLRPFGYEIFGDEKSLTVGGGEFSRNTVSGGSTFINFG